MKNKKFKQKKKYWRFVEEWYSDRLDRDATLRHREERCSHWRISGTRSNTPFDTWRDQRPESASTHSSEQSPWFDTAYSSPSSSSPRNHSSAHSKLRKSIYSQHWDLNLFCYFKISFQKKIRENLIIYLPYRSIRAVAKDVMSEVHFVTLAGGVMFDS